MSSTINPILCDSITRQTSTKTALAVELPNKKLIASTVKSLSPLPTTLRHCKRVRVIENEILCLITEEDKANFKDYNIHEVLVPEFPSFVRTQFEDAKTHWPVHFHPDARLEELLTGKTPGIWDRLEFHARHMFERKEPALIVDPKTDTVVAAGEDLRNLHPLRHPTLCAIQDLSNKDSEYLATGLDIYLEREPCAMCSMALVHMRIKRIFFKEDNPKLGALKSKMKLHTLPGINHVFQVFQMNK